MNSRRNEWKTKIPRNQKNNKTKTTDKSQRNESKTKLPRNKKNLKKNKKKT